MDGPRRPARQSQAWRAAKEAATALAVERGDDFVGDAHVLFALASDRGCAAGRLLESAGVRAEAVLECLGPPGEGGGEPDASEMRALSVTAMEMSLRAGQLRVNTLNLLAGMLRRTHTEAAAVLAAAGVALGEEAARDLCEQAGSVAEDPAVVVETADHLRLQGWLLELNSLRAAMDAAGDDRLDGVTAELRDAVVAATRALATADGSDHSAFFDNLAAAAAGARDAMRALGLKPPP